MALRAPDRIAPNEAVAAPETEHPSLAVYSASHFRERLWNLLPLTISLFLATSIFWGPFALPQVLAVGITAFFVYWLGRSYAVAIACVVGLRKLGNWKATNWQAKYCEWLPSHPEAMAWEWPRHMVIIPNYKESEEGLSRTLDSLATQANAGQLTIVMAMEAREAEAQAKAANLVRKYRNSFGDMFATFHPAGLPNETPGKGSNEAWAAREAYLRLIEHGGQDILRYTITSCDADAVFHPRHFEALNYLFLTGKDPYRTFWQPAIFNSNNIWDIPAPLRIPDGLSGINRLSNMVLPGSVKFPTSCYSLSWKMLHEVDYWDEEVIPEDWHIFMKCCYTLGDRVHVEGLFLPLGNDCVLTDGYWKTLRAHYAQSVRHAWGASDIPYAWRAAANPQSPLSRGRKVLLATAVTKVHSLWMSQWYIVTMGNIVPMLLSEKTASVEMPHWWIARFPISLPGPTWHISEMAHGDFSNPLGWMINVNLVGALIYFCIFPLFVMIAFEYKARGPRPAYVSRRAAVAGFLMWPAMAVITFFFASMPALHAQWKLASGTGLVYRVAEKGSRKFAGVPAAMHAAAHVAHSAVEAATHPAGHQPETVAESIPLSGGGGQ
ncbi:MAG TPA: glycosyltransferase family 2 protein [Tepidiformaceae bacterium]|nr:glycosyltransferase family 2 protein [Tepidiformaceae bacterium]